jgi:archaemetzincin
VTTRIHILNASSLSHQELAGIARLVEGIFRLPVTVTAVPMELEQAFDPSRGQYHSTALLSWLLDRHIAPGEKCIAVVEVDLFIPVLTFVFGEAQFEGPASIVSLHRLANQFYGMPPDVEATLRRLAKEVVHELGHTFGLYHCHQFECVMRSSTYVEEIDLKQAEPCPACLGTLAQKVIAEQSLS